MKKILTIAAAACLIGQAAFAHAFLDRASPAVGSEVSGSPPALNLTYTEPVEPLFSTVQVTDATGARVDEGKPTTQDDGRILVGQAEDAAAGNLQRGVACHLGRHPQDRGTLHLHREALNDQRRHDDGVGPGPAPGGDFVAAGNGRLPCLDPPRGRSNPRRAAPAAGPAVVDQRLGSPGWPAWRGSHCNPPPWPEPTMCPICWLRCRWSPATPATA